MVQQSVMVVWWNLTLLTVTLIENDVRLAAHVNNLKELILIFYYLKALDVALAMILNSAVECVLKRSDSVF